jgi:hypothetical protein
MQTQELDARTARELLRYEPETGELFWRERSRHFFRCRRSWHSWNTRYSLKEVAKGSRTNGYRVLTIFGKRYRAHRVIWLLVYGEFPLEEIDHINGNKIDNSLKNLRCVTSHENNKNAKRPHTNRSGVVGVSLLKKTGEWYASVSVNHKTISLGSFKTLGEAAVARKAAEIKYGFHDNHGRP